MKKILLVAAAALGMLSAQAQQALEYSNFGANWSVGLDGGVTTPIVGHAFWGSMRGTVGLHVAKQVSPLFGFGVEASTSINTSSWNPSPMTYGIEGENGRSKTAFDDLYVGAFGTMNLSNLFGGYPCKARFFEVELLLGAGWGHQMWNKNASPYYDANDPDHTHSYYNYFVTKYGLNFNFNLNKNWTIALKPSITWNMTGTPATNPLDVTNTDIAYNVHQAAFNCVVGVTYNFGPGFKCVEPKNQAEIDALNAQINDLRAALDACGADLAASQAALAACTAELEACKARPVEVVKEVNNNLNSVRFVFFKKASYTITADQQPNVEMIAAYLKNHPGSKVVIKGYASPEGNLDYNIKLAANRAEAVKKSLINKYKISADRITAEGEGIGNMFTEESWNRVSVCTIEDK